MCELKTQEIEITRNHRHADVSMRFNSMGKTASQATTQQSGNTQMTDRKRRAKKSKANKLLEPWWS